MLSITTMFVISIVASLLSSMNLWVSDLRHVRLTLNDIYMAGMMTGWMFLFEGLALANSSQVAIGSLLIPLCYIAIRMQLFVTARQYAQGMIPHHSMAIMMSKRLMEKEGARVLGGYPRTIASTQEAEIKIFEGYLKNMT